jgi:DnaK suppressor protein
MPSHRVRARLDARRRQLLVRYRAALAQAEAVVGDDGSELVDVANDRWDARILGVMSERDALALENIVAALNRLDAGHYGRCTSCGKHIASARLRIVPEAATCTRCANEFPMRSTAMARVSEA